MAGRTVARRRAAARLGAAALGALLWVAAPAAAEAEAAPAAGPDFALLLAEGRPAPLLSAYRLFADGAAQVPAPGVVPYRLNTALFSDHAEKFRFVALPPGTSAQWHDTEVFDFPVGTVLVKTFAYPADLHAPDRDVRLVETRLLVRRAEGWVAWPYVWDEDGREARYRPAGLRTEIAVTGRDGAPLTIRYAVPNVNQCKGCHVLGEAMTPIGPKARNLNDPYPYPDGAENQLAHWTRLGLLAGAPSDPASAPRVPRAFDGADGTLEARARAYLDVNCAHCHRAEGPASTSGLFLTWTEANPTHWGVWKRPVAAGRGSAGLAFSITPGHPDRSILPVRMGSTDPGVMMPELGRSLVHDEGVALIRDWIAAMPPAPPPP